ncbi:hypothetical protein [Planococcus sp. MB-3u-03]|uniref:hypothetical protein n=1 Tax=Planococcus sp. MB-3u-03 TaxID=2058136 RepID=UPI0018E38487|nr:hypothetical protein [Planococcus sp. MB-3u-03]
MRAFIKRYAQAVGMDGDALLREHKSELPEDEPEAVPAEHLTRRPEKKRSSGPVAESMPKVLVALFIVFILLVIWYFYLLSTSGTMSNKKKKAAMWNTRLRLNKRKNNRKRPRKKKLQLMNRKNN